MKTGLSKSQDRSGIIKPITKRGNVHCDWFILPLLLPTPTVWFSLNRNRRPLVAQLDKCLSTEQEVVGSNLGRTNTQSLKNNWGECAALVMTSRVSTVLNSRKSLQTWKKSRKMVKCWVLYKWNLFRFGQILLNLACTFSANHEKSFVPESFKVSINHVWWHWVWKKKVLFW